MKIECRTIICSRPVVKPGAVVIYCLVHERGKKGAANAEGDPDIKKGMCNSIDDDYLHRSCLL